MPVPARLPDWAIWAGCPEPTEGEMFSDYVRRLGLDPEPMLEGLNERTYGLANYRLWSVLMRKNPHGFSEYLARRREALS